MSWGGFEVPCPRGDRARVGGSHVQGDRGRARGGGPALYSKFHCVMGNVHLGPSHGKTDWRTDTYENITFPQLRWRTVKIGAFQWQNVTPGGNRTQAASDSKSNTILSTLTWHVLLRRSLNFCSCTTWCLDDLRRINRAWLYKEPKVSVLQANVKLV